MTIDWKKIKAASPDHPIYKSKYQVYPVSSLEDYKKQREEKEGLKNIFLEPVKGRSKEELTQAIIRQLERHGVRIKNKKGVNGKEQKKS